VLVDPHLVFEGPGGGGGWRDGWQRVATGVTWGERVMRQR
jgi:hypothetical protein